MDLTDKGTGKLIQPFFDPRGRPTVTAGSDHCLCTCYPSVPTFQNHLAKQKQISSVNNVHYWRVCGWAEWIIDDSTVFLFEFQTMNDFVFK